MLEAQGIRVSRGSRCLLAGISLALRPGEVTAVLGPNGAGKTTLLRVLSGEWSADSGSVTLDGRPLESHSIRELGRRRAFLHQGSTLDFDFTVLETVLLGRSPHMQGSERPEDYAAARRALEAVDLSDRARDRYTRLSGGERQRVHLARVLCQIEEPSVSGSRYLFLDEPSNNLDLSHRDTIYRMVRRLAADGVSVCLVEHDLNHAFHLADRVLVLNKGHLELEGAPAILARSPDCDRIFQVTLQRLEVPGRSCPWLVPAGTEGGASQGPLQPDPEATRTEGL